MTTEAQVHAHMADDVWSLVALYLYRDSEAGIPAMLSLRLLCRDMAACLVFDTCCCSACVHHPCIPYVFSTCPLCLLVFARAEYCAHKRRRQLLPVQRWVDIARIMFAKHEIRPIECSNAFACGRATHGDSYRLLYETGADMALCDLRAICALHALYGRVDAVAALTEVGSRSGYASCSRRILLAIAIFNDLTELYDYVADKWAMSDGDVENITILLCESRGPASVHPYWPGRVVFPLVLSDDKSYPLVHGLCFADGDDNDVIPPRTEHCCERFLQHSTRRPLIQDVLRHQCMWNRVSDLALLRNMCSFRRDNSLNILHMLDLVDALRRREPKVVVRSISERHRWTGLFNGPHIGRDAYMLPYIGKLWHLLFVPAYCHVRDCCLFGRDNARDMSAAFQSEQHVLLRSDWQRLESMQTRISRRSAHGDLREIRFPSTFATIVPLVLPRDAPLPIIIALGRIHLHLAVYECLIHGGTQGVLPQLRSILTNAVHAGIDVDQSLRHLHKTSTLLLRDPLSISAIDWAELCRIWQQYVPGRLKTLVKMLYVTPGVAVACGPYIMREKGDTWKKLYNYFHANMSINSLLALESMACADEDTESSQAHGEVYRHITSDDYCLDICAWPLLLNPTRKAIFETYMRIRHGRLFRPHTPGAHIANSLYQQGVLTELFVETDAT